MSITKEEVIEVLRMWLDLYDQGNMNRHALEQQLSQYILALLESHET